MEAVFEWLRGETGENVAGLFSGWEIVYHKERGDKTAAALLKGTEVHFIVNPAWRKRLMTRAKIRAFLEPLLTRRGMLLTRSLKDAEAARQFITRIGFRHTWSDDTFDYYILTELPYGR
jgi:hypothetical protein